MPINYKAVAFCQTASGVWGEKLLKLLKVETATQLVEAQKDEQLKAMSAQVILTIVGIQLLKTQFAGNNKEWRLVAAKGAGFLKSQGLPLTLEQMLEKIDTQAFF